MSEYTLPPIKISELSEIISLRNDDIFVINEQDSFTTKIKWIDVINDLTSRNLVFSGNVLFTGDIKTPALDSRFLFRDLQDNVSELINDVGYITKNALEGFIKVSDNVGLLTNDVGYITKWEYENGLIVDPNTLYKGDDISNLNNDVGYITGIDNLYEIGDCPVRNAKVNEILMYDGKNWNPTTIPLIADVLKFQGVIDATINGPNLGAITLGIYYIHRGPTAVAHPNWNGLQTVVVREGDRLIFARDGKWHQLGNVNDGHEHIELRDLSATTDWANPYSSSVQKAGGRLSYDQSVGLFTLEPTDLSDYVNFVELSNVLDGKNPDGTDKPGDTNRYLRSGRVDSTKELKNEGDVRDLGPFLCEVEVTNILEGKNPDGTDKPAGDRYLKAGKKEFTSELKNNGPDENGGLRDIYITQAETYAILGINPDTGNPLDPTSPRYLRSNKIDLTSELKNDGHTANAGDKFITEGETFTLLGLDANGNPDPNNPTTYLRRNKQDSTGELINEGNTVGGSDPFITKGETYNLLGLDANGNPDPNNPTTYLRRNKLDKTSELLNDGHTANDGDKFITEGETYTLLGLDGNGNPIGNTAKFLRPGGVDSTDELINTGDGTDSYSPYITKAGVDRILGLDNPSAAPVYLRRGGVDKVSELDNDAGYITQSAVGNGTLTIKNSDNSTAGTFTANQSGPTNITLPAGFSGDYRDLDNKPTIGNGTLTIKNSDNSTAGTFTANQVTDTEITLPAGFSGNYNDLTNKPTIGDGTITIKDSKGGTIGSFTTNQTGSKNISLPAGNYNDLTNKPTIPTVGNRRVNIKQNGAQKGSFTMNESGGNALNIDLADTIVDAYTKTQSDNRYIPLDINSLPEIS